MDTPTEWELVLLPGLDGTGRLFAPLLQILPASLSVRVVDYPLQEPLTYPELVDYVRERIPRDRAVVVCAESFSGPIAIDLCSAEGVNVKGIIMCATFAHSPRPILLGVAKLLPLSVLFRLPIPKVLVRFFLLGKEADGSLIRLFLESVSMVRTGILVSRFREVAAMDVRSKLRAVKVPCCYIRAKSDKLVPSRCLTPFQESISNLVVKEVEGPHFILQANPRACSQVILDFMNTLTG